MLRLIGASAFPSVFTVNVVKYGCVLLNLSVFPDFKPNQHAGNKKRKIFIYMCMLLYVYALVREDDPRALASGLSPIQTQNHAITCLLHQHTFVLYALRESDVKYWNIMKGGIRLIKASII